MVRSGPWSAAVVDLLGSCLVFGFGGFEGRAVHGSGAAGCIAHVSQVES